MTSPITNGYDPTASRARLEVERVFLYEPDKEWAYSHHASLIHFGGRFYAMWSNGRVHEDDLGQRVLIASGEAWDAWSEPTPLVDSRPGQYGERVYTAAGFHPHDGRLVAYAGQYDYLPEYVAGGHRNTASPADKGHCNTGLNAMTSDDGENWSDLIDLGVPIVPNHPPQPTSSGRLIISGNIMFPCTDQPDGLSGWRPTGIYPADMAEEIFDDSEGFWHVRARQGWEPGLCEGSFYETDDGRLHMLLRSGQKRLWVTHSDDDGAVWSSPEPTDFSDVNSKFHFGRLPDGRFYYVGTPDPDGQRNPLVLSVSEDGAGFDRHWIMADESYERRVAGLHKGGQYGYPHTLIHDGYLYTIVSRQKEAVEVIRFEINRL